MSWADLGARWDLGAHSWSHPYCWTPLQASLLGRQVRRGKEPGFFRVRGQLGMLGGWPQRCIMRSSPESRRCRLDELPFLGFRQKRICLYICGYGTGQLCFGTSRWHLVKQIILLQRIHVSGKTKSETRNKADTIFDHWDAGNFAGETLQPLFVFQWLCFVLD